MVPISRSRSGAKTNTPDTYCTGPSTRHSTLVESEPTTTALRSNSHAAAGLPYTDIDSFFVPDPTSQPFAGWSGVMRGLCGSRDRVLGKESSHIHCDKKAFHLPSGGKPFPDGVSSPWNVQNVARLKAFSDQKRSKRGAGIKVKLFTLLWLKVSEEKKRALTLTPAREEGKRFSGSC
uniref:Uncharacterized protein n=1 Tax=Populus alba TaxID=43335 RepID=A0A4U5PYF5_POPAL|nr:hypothetical protein D5086_0000160450 [Populus alba]